MSFWRLFRFLNTTISAPALERREILAKLRLVFFAGQALARILVEFIDELRTEFDHLFHVEVAGEGAVFVAIDAVFFVQIGLTLPNLILQS